mmetsp:Transcript_36311/g.116615  ORF Transcript_36311/g.116615 Transcript_36311/m.116615 type:complete len:260 (+) Transcript_36311:1215-1994(+)
MLKVQSPTVMCTPLTKGDLRRAVQGEQWLGSTLVTPRGGPSDPGLARLAMTKSPSSEPHSRLLCASALSSRSSAMSTPRCSLASPGIVSGMRYVGPHPSFFFFWPSSPSTGACVSSRARATSQNSSCPSPAMVANSSCFPGSALSPNRPRSERSAVCGSQATSVTVARWDASTADTYIGLTMIELDPPSSGVTSSPVIARSSMAAVRALARSHTTTWPEVTPPTTISGLDGQNLKAKTSPGACSTNCGVIGSAKLHNST